MIFQTFMACLAFTLKGLMLANIIAFKFSF